MEIGVAQGRFHIIHWGHMEYLLEAKKICKYLIIGVTDCDPERAYFQYSKEIMEFNKKSNSPFRSIKNPVFPFTFYDRLYMIKSSLLYEGVSSEEFDIVPFPIHKPEFIKYYIPLNSTIFVTIYDDWGRKKIEIFKKLGFNVKILWERDMNTRFTTGEEVRRRIVNGEDWKELVPLPVYEYITKNKLDVILKNCG